MASKMATPRYCIQHSRFTKQNGWRLVDVSLSLNGNIAVTGHNVNTHRTCIDVYTNARHSDSRDRPKIIYSKEFEKYTSEDRREYRGRTVSFYPGSDTTILSGHGDKLEVIDLIQDRVIKCRKIKLVKHGGFFSQILCLSVTETGIFIGFRESNKITVYDVIDLHEIKSIILQGIPDGYSPFDMLAISGRIFVCIVEPKEESKHKSLIFEEKNGRILSELAKPTDSVQWYVSSVGANINTLGIAALVWRDSFLTREGICWQIVFHSLLSENNCSFLIVEVESGVGRIRISDRGDRMVTGNFWTGEVKVYDMAEVFTYSHFKEKLASTLQIDECTKLANFFKIPKDQTDDILSSDKSSERLLLVLETKNILQPNNVDRLIEAFDEFRTNPFCRHVTDIFKKTRSTYYEEVTEKLGEEMKTLRITNEEDGREESKAPWTLHKAPDGRFYYHNSETKELRWENPETGQRAESQDKSAELYLNLSSKPSEFLQESSFEGEFGKFCVRVSEKLTKADCLKLATYFNFPAAKMDQIRNDFETPGITLFNILKERHHVSIHNVMSLKEALEELELKDISETLVTPYQRKIDRLRFEQQYLLQ